MRYMMRRECYQPPLVLKAVTVLLERGFLESAVSAQTKVKTMGQEVVNKDFSTPTFVQEWDSTPFSSGD